MSESQVVAACIQLLCLWGCDVIRNNSGAIKTEKGHWFRFGKKGTGDILAISPYGRWVEIECKFGANDLSDEQRKRQQLVTQMNGVYIVARSIDELERHKNRILAKAEWINQPKE